VQSTPYPASPVQQLKMRAPDSAPLNWKPSRAHFKESFERKVQVTPAVIEEVHDHEIRESIEIDEKENGLKRGLRKMTGFGKRVTKKIEKWAKGMGKKMEREETGGLSLRKRERRNAVSSHSTGDYMRDEGMMLAMKDRDELAVYRRGKN
jgi:hypothetical protein